VPWCGVKKRSALSGMKGINRISSLYEQRAVVVAYQAFSGGNRLTAEEAGLTRVAVSETDCRQT